MFKVLIVEDTKMVADHLEKSLVDYGCDVVGKASSVADAIQMFDVLQPELVMIDIVLRETNNGVDVAEHINKKNRVPFIYLTDYYGAEQKHFKKAEATQPANYLPKAEYLPKQLWHFIEDAMYNFYANKENIPQHIAEKFGLNDHYTEYANGVHIKIPIADIHYIEVARKTGRSTTIFHLKDNSTKYCSSPLSKIIDKYSQFVRIHRKYAVNKKHIQRIVISSKCVILGDSHTLPIGRSYKNEVVALL